MSGNNDVILLNDWMTSPEMPFHSKITENDDNNIFHTHNFYEIFYILEGSITHVLNGKTQVLHTGDMVFTNRKDVHSFLREPGNTCKHRDIVIRTDFFDSVCEFIGPDFKHAYASNLLPKVITLPFDRIERYENRIVNVILTADINSEFKPAVLRTLLVSLLNCLIEEETQRDNNYYPMWFRELLGRFHMNDFLKAGLDEILSPYHFSKSYMCRAFQHYMGCTMTDYLNDIRLQHAAFQLQYTDETIISICNSIGFSSVSYFNTVFKRKYGVAPNNFRKTQKMLSKGGSSHGKEIAK